MPNSKGGESTAYAKEGGKVVGFGNDSLQCEDGVRFEQAENRKVSTAPLEGF